MNSKGLSLPTSSPGAQPCHVVTSCEAALYPFLLGAEWDALDPSVQRFHEAACDRQASGRFQIHRGQRRIARLFASLLGFPAEGRDVATQLTVEFRSASSSESSGSQSPGHEIWKRNFANQPLRSVQYMKGPGVLGERFGLIELSLRLSVCEAALFLEAIGAALAVGKLRLALPSFLTPRVQARVKSTEGFSGRLDVSVQMALPLVGPVLSYEGYLDPEEAKS